MALVTVHRTPTPSLSSESQSLASESVCDADHSSRSISKACSVSESYLTVKGAALILSPSQCLRKTREADSNGTTDIHRHLQSMISVLRSYDTIKLAVRLESQHQQMGHYRYMTIVSTNGCGGTEESAIVGIDIMENKPRIGLVVPVLLDIDMRLDGDGGICVTSNNRQHVFKPVSVQALWSALQSIIGVRDIAQTNKYIVGGRGITHTWTDYYRVRISSPQSAINEWHQMEDIMSHRPVNSEGTKRADFERVIRHKLKDIMMTVDLEEVTSKYLRTRLEKELNMALTEYKQFIDEEMIVIMRQMDAPSQIFDYLYLGSEWNASNLEELKRNSVGAILNVTKEIDNFFPGLYEYCNVRVYDTEETELLQHWHKTYEFINKARNNHQKVLVHCKMGVSRSASTVIAFAMKEYGWSMDKAYNYVKDRRSCIRPNDGFKQQLATYEGILYASKKRYSCLWKPGSHENDEEGIARRLTPSPEMEMELNMLSLMNNNEGDVVVTRESVDTNTSSKTLPLVFAIDDWQNYDNDGTDSDSDPQWHTTDSSDNDDWSVVPDECSVQLLSHVKHDWVTDEWCATVPFSSLSSAIFDNWSDIDSDSEETGKTSSSPHRRQRSERGFYDVAMLTGGLCDPPMSSDESATEAEIVHPDVRLESMLAEHHKQRLIADQIASSLSDSSPNANSVQSDDSSKSRPINICCQGVRVRPDGYWIREQLQSKTGCDAGEKLSQSPASFGQSPSLGSDGVNFFTVSDESPATVKTKTDVVVVSDREMIDEESRAMKTILRPLSIYEIEDIPVEPGIVHRTRLEIEQRDRSSSLVDITSSSPVSPPMCDLSPVQRSSSFRMPRPKTSPDKFTRSSKIRTSERRLTCVPFFLRDSPHATAAADVKPDVESVRPVEASSSAAELSGLLVYRVGDDNVEMELGKVEKTRRDFEEKMLEDTVQRPQILPLCVAACSNEQFISTPDDIPIEVGSVKRTKKELELKYVTGLKTIPHARTPLRDLVGYNFELDPEYGRLLASAENTSDSDHDVHLQPAFRRSYSCRESSLCKLSPDKLSLFSRAASVRSRRPTGSIDRMCVTETDRVEGGESPREPDTENVAVPVMRIVLNDADSKCETAGSSAIRTSDQSVLVKPDVPTGTDVGATTTRSGSGHALKKSFSFTAVPADAGEPPSTVALQGFQQSAFKQRLSVFETITQPIACTPPVSRHSRSWSLSDRMSPYTFSVDNRDVSVTTSLSGSASATDCCAAKPEADRPSSLDKGAVPAETSCAVDSATKSQSAVQKPTNVERSVDGSSSSSSCSSNGTDVMPASDNAEKPSNNRTNIKDSGPYSLAVAATVTVSDTSVKTRQSGAVSENASSLMNASKSKKLHGVTHPLSKLSTAFVTSDSTRTRLTTTEK